MSIHSQLMSILIQFPFIPISCPLIQFCVPTQMDNRPNLYAKQSQLKDDQIILPGPGPCDDDEQKTELDPNCHEDTSSMYALYKEDNESESMVFNKKEPGQLKFPPIAKNTELPMIKDSLLSSKVSLPKCGSEEPKCQKKAEAGPKKEASTVQVRTPSLKQREKSVEAALIHKKINEDTQEQQEQQQGHLQSPQQQEGEIKIAVSKGHQQVGQQEEGKEKACQQAGQQEEGKEKACQQAGQQELSNSLQVIKEFEVNQKSETISFEDGHNTACAVQSGNYWENNKLVLSGPVTSLLSECTFRIDNLKYCVGVGVALREIVKKHGFTYESDGSNELGHGLYIVTSQGYSWSHSEKDEDDMMREGFEQVYTGVQVRVRVEDELIHIAWKKGEFTMRLPSELRHKYTLTYCAYLHEKGDSVSIV